MNEILTPHLRLRPLRDSDLAPLLRIIHEPSVRRWWGAYDEEMLRSELTSADTYTLVIELRPGAEPPIAGLVMVYEEPDPSYRHAGLDISLATEVQGKGYGPEALRAVAADLFARGHHRITIDPAADNARAIAAYRKVGFRVVGRLREYQRAEDGGWEDGLLMELLARELT